MTLFFAVIPLLVLSGIESDVQWQHTLASILINPVFLVVSTVVLSLLMVAELPLFSLKFKGFGWKGNKVRYMFLTMSLILFATLLFWSIPFIIILYLILSIINNTIHKKNEI
jgi:CDP-diacylglycerol--serine O-phosphatidyltransferase